MESNIERRAGIELRAIDGRQLSGYAAVFDEWADIGGAFREKIAAGAFTASLAQNSDILALADHSTMKVLGRTRSKTLTLREDDKGLAFDISLPDTQAAHDVLALAERGDLGGMSFGFITKRDAWPKPDQRILQEIDLREISVVSAWPAYEGTSVSARSMVAGRHRLRVAKLWMEALS